MSLIHWWPLNGNTNDLGLNPTSLTNNGATINGAGKIGNCYYLSASSGFVGAFNTNALMRGACSFSLWIKIPETEYKARVNNFTYDSDHILMNSRVFGTNGSYTNTGLCLALQTNNIYSSGSVSSISLYMGWRDSNSAPIFEPYTIAFNTWYHVVITKDASGKMIMYINGLKVKGPLQASANAFAESNFYINTGAVWGSGNYRNSNAPMYLNDFRIYDHALSAKEVKEISKGLVLHYNFEDKYIEPTANLFGGRTDFSNTNHWSRSQINATAPTIDTDGNMVLYGAGTDGNHQSYTVSSNGGYITISPSTTYTLSVYVKYSSTNAYFNIYFYERTDSAAVKTNVQRLGCTADEVGKWVLRKLTVTTQSTTTKMYTELNCYKCLATETIVMKNNTVQLEAKDHATPYINGARSVGKVYDNSGYGNNGTVTGNCQIKSDSAAGKHSIYSPAGANYVERQNFPVAGFNTDQQFTINAWIKIVGYVGSDWNTIFRLASTNARDQQLHFCYNASGNIILSQFSDDPQFTTNVALNTWAMVTWVHYKEGSTAKCKYFVNGQQVGNTQSYSGLLNIQDNARLTLFYDSIRNSYGANLHMGDFKIYSTALSEEDIKAEYNRKAAIDKNGNLFTGEIVETTYNLLTSENLFNGRVKTNATSNVGEIVTRNNYSAYRISPVPYWSGDEATSKNICKGQFGSGQYIFDLWIDVDEIYYDGNGRWVPGGFVVYYTDGSVDNVVIDANSTQGHSGYQHLIRKTNANKIISGLGVYYYIGVPIYIRCDSVICKVNSDGKICKNNIIAGGQYVEPAVSDSKCKLTRYGFVSNAIKEL